MPTGNRIDVGNSAKKGRKLTGQGEKIRVAVNGYGVIGKRVADAVASEDDMQPIGIADIETDWRMRTALRKGSRLFAARSHRW